MGILNSIFKNYMEQIKTKKSEIEQMKKSVSELLTKYEQLNHYVEQFKSNWADKTSEFVKESESVSDYINQQIREKYIVKAIKTGTTLLPVEIEDRKYIVDFVHSKIYIADIPKEYMLFAKKDTRRWGYLPYVELYKNYSQQYKDIELIFNFLDDYFSKKTNNSKKWNTVEMVDNVFNFVMNLENYTGKKIYNLHFLYITNDKGINYNKKYIDKLSVQNLKKYMELYKNILVSDSDNILINERDFIALRKILGLLSNFELTRGIFSELNDSYSFKAFNTLYSFKNDILNYINYVFSFDNNRDSDMNNTQYYKYVEMINTLINKTENIEKNFNNFNNSKKSDLFYNPTFFKFLLPEEHFTVDDSRILTQIHLLNGSYKNIYITFLPEDKDFSISVDLNHLLLVKNFLDNSKAMKKFTREQIFNFFCNGFDYMKESSWFSCSFNNCNENDKEAVMSLARLVFNHMKPLIRLILDETEKQHLDLIEQKQKSVHQKTNTEINNDNNQLVATLS